MNAYSYQPQCAWSEEFHGKNGWYHLPLPPIQTKTPSFPRILCGKSFVAINSILDTILISHCIIQICLHTLRGNEEMSFLFHRSASETKWYPNDKCRRRHTSPHSLCVCVHLWQRTVHKRLGLSRSIHSLDATDPFHSYLFTSRVDLFHSEYRWIHFSSDSSSFQDDEIPEWRDEQKTKGEKCGTGIENSRCVLCVSLCWLLIYYVSVWMPNARIRRQQHTRPVCSNNRRIE